MVAQPPTVAATAPSFIATDVTEDTVWDDTRDHVLASPIFVRRGATLTITAGAVIRGAPRSSTGDAGALIVEARARLRVLGNASDPVVMTDLYDDNVRGQSPSAVREDRYFRQNNGLTARWGGLVLLGDARLATAEASGTKTLRWLRGCALRRQRR